MIQRIQSIWLLLATLTAGAVFYTDVYRAEILKDSTAITEHLRVGGHFPSLLIAVLMVLLPFISIFLFKNRKKQRNMVWLSILICIGFIAINLFRISGFTATYTGQLSNHTYHVGSILPVVVIIFLILAIRGINKDEKLIRSLDRLR